jgi:predicted SpoU family rRNA methylase
MEMTNSVIGNVRRKLVVLGDEQVACAWYGILNWHVAESQTPAHPPQLLI